MDGDELLEVYGQALRDAGYGGQELSLVDLARSRSAPRASTREAFEVFAQLRSAPTVLALIQMFAEQSALRDRNDFAVSCLPSTKRSADFVRACTVSVGTVEVCYVLLDVSLGTVSDIVVFGESDEDLSWLDAHWADDESGIEAHEAHLDGGGIRLWLPGDIALDLLSERDIGGVVARRVAGVRDRRQRSRRNDWHNRWLWALVGSGVAPPPDLLSPPAREWDVSSEDALRLVRQRTSQQAFRRQLLASGPRECAICGINVVEVLEAAHLVSHARGGAASSENGRLLCANHHRAYDARLYQWTGSEFTWAGPDEEPLLGQQKLR